MLHTVDKREDAGTTWAVGGATQARGTGTAHFRLGDLRIAVDICIDHDDKPAKKEGREADLHLVTAGGSPSGPTGPRCGPRARA